MAREAGCCENVAWRDEVECCGSIGWRDEVSANLVRFDVAGTLRQVSCLDLPYGLRFEVRIIAGWPMALAVGDGDSTVGGMGQLVGPWSFIVWALTSRGSDHRLPHL